MLTQRDSRLRRVALKLALAAPVAIGAAMIMVSPAGATIIGPCTATGYSTPADKGKPQSIADAKAGGTSVNLATSPRWDVPSYKDYLAGEGSSTGDMSSGAAYITVFGFTYPVASGTGSGHIGSGGPLSVADYAKGIVPSKVIDISGSAQPDPNSSNPASGPCQGDVTIVFNDVDPNTTVIGVLSIVLMVIGFGPVLFNVVMTVAGR